MVIPVNPASARERNSALGAPGCTIPEKSAVAIEVAAIAAEMQVIAMSTPPATKQARPDSRNAKRPGLFPSSCGKSLWKKKA